MEKLWTDEAWDGYLCFVCKGALADHSFYHLFDVCFNYEYLFLSDRSMSSKTAAVASRFVKH